MADWGRLLERLGAETARGVGLARLKAFEKEHGLSLPDDLRDLYRASDGFSLAGGAMRILPLDEVSAYVEGFRRFGIPAVWGYFPFTDTNDSNPFCVCCDSPLRGRIVHVRHDDSARLTHRSLESFFEAIRPVLADPFPDGAGPAIYDPPCDYVDPAAPRTRADVQTARELLALAETFPANSVERGDALRFAIALFSDKEVDDLAKLLDGDQYTRDDALARLNGINSAEARAAVEKGHESTRRFVAECVKAIRAAGVEVAEVKGDCPRLEPGAVWMNLPMWFGRRSEPGVIDEIVAKAKEFTSEKRKKK